MGHPSSKPTTGLLKAAQRLQLQGKQVDASMPFVLNKSPSDATAHIRKKIMAVTSDLYDIDFSSYERNTSLSLLQMSCLSKSLCYFAPKKRVYLAGSRLLRESRRATSQELCLSHVLSSKFRFYKTGDRHLNEEGVLFP